MEPLFRPGLSPPAGLTRWMDVWSPSGVGPVEAVVLSDDVVLIMCHWSGRCFPCPGPDCCTYCVQQSARLIYGFVPAHVFSPVHDQVVLRLTPFAADDLLRVKSSQGGRLRGAKVRLWRRSPGQTARVRVGLAEMLPPSTVPPAWDVLPHLRRVWGCGDFFRFYSSPEEAANHRRHEPAEGEITEEGGGS